MKITTFTIWLMAYTLAAFAGIVIFGFTYVSLNKKYYITVDPIFAWYDLWIGCFYDKKKQWFYFFPFPCIGIVIKFHPKNTEI